MAPHNRYLAIHTIPTGIGDARPTAMDIIRDEHMESALKGKTVLLTGGGAGIGVETARAIAATGADMYITARNLGRARSALTNVLEEHQYTLLKMDQNSLQSVRDAAKRLLEWSNNRCNLLICTAGMMAWPQSKAVDGSESQFGVNHLSHFLLFQLLKPALLASATAGFGSRVVMVASSGHRNSGVNFGDIMFEHTEYKPFVAYGQSKTSNIYMANEIERRFDEQAVHGLSLHPGGIRTGLQKHMDQEMVKGWDVSAVSTLSVQASDVSLTVACRKTRRSKKWSKIPAQGASTIVFAATSKDWEGRGGVYLEDCDESIPFEGGDMRSGIGYKPYAYDKEAARRLWEVSLEMVGMSEEV